MESFQIETIKPILAKLKNWKSPGNDKIHNFWLKNLSALHSKFVECINAFIEEPQSIPHHLTTGVTYLIPKGSRSSNPARYRPITCLNTFYKLLTSCVSKILEDHCNGNSILAEQQKGCKKGSLGCKEQLIIDSVVLKQASNKQRNLFAAYIDYQKAYDSVPHDWLIDVLKIYKIHPKLIDFCATLTTKWKTEIVLKTKEMNIITNKIDINRGIFQGDSLSPLWFCLALNPLSTILNSSKYGYEIKSRHSSYRLSHLAYMDDIKLYASTASSLKQLLNITETFSEDIGMCFGVDKCRTVNVVRGKLTRGLEYETQRSELIKSLDHDEVYKYLGLEQSRTIAHSEVKKRITAEFKDRLTKVLKTSLNSRNLATAINIYAIPVIVYSMGLIKWSQTDLEAMDRYVRTQMTQYRYHHSKSAVERINLPREKGGRGITNITNSNANQISLMRKYFLERAETSAMHKAIVEADFSFTP